jgi:hypothetical protein
VEMRQLEYFVAVADKLSFSRGAARVHVVQSAISTAIAKLEHELGVELFDRSRLRISLTPAGTTFLTEARMRHVSFTNPFTSVLPVLGPRHPIAGWGWWTCAAT